MQTIKCVVVGDGAVGKVSENIKLIIPQELSTFHLDNEIINIYHLVDMSFNFLYNQQISFWICSYCMDKLVLWNEKETNLFD